MNGKQAYFCEMADFDKYFKSLQSYKIDGITEHSHRAALQELVESLAAKVERLKEKLVKLEGEMQRLAAMEKMMLASPDQQISLTDPDSRSMATSGRGSGVVGYNVQVAVDTEHHLIITQT